MKPTAWKADVVNDRARGFALMIEIWGDDVLRGKIFRDDVGQLQLLIYPLAGELLIPISWLANILQSADKDLP